MKTDDNPPVRSPIPDGAMIAGEIVITSYMDESGQMMYCVHCTDDLNMAQALGLCEAAKISLYNSYIATVEDGDDDEETE